MTMFIKIKQYYNNWNYSNIVASVSLIVAAFLLSIIFLPSGLPPGVIFLGAVNGGLYGLTALGIVLLYRSQKIINFAQASLGGIAVAIAVVLVDRYHISYWIAILFGLASAAVTGYLTEVLVVRRLKKSSRMILTVATLGVAQVIGAIQIAIPAWFNVTELGTYGTPFHFQFTIHPYILTGDYIVAIFALVICLGLLWFFLEKTDTGIALRAVSDNTDRARLLGIPVKRISVIAWTVAALLAAVAELASAPSSMSNPPDLSIAAGPIVLLAPLAAAIIGRMENLVVTAIAGCMIGIFEQAIFWSYPKSTVVDVGMFLIILISLLIQPPVRSKADQLISSGFVNFKESRPIAKILAELKFIKVSRLAIPVILLIAAIVIPMTNSQITDLPFVYIAIYAIIAVSLVILSGWAGQISLGQFGFAGIGAATTALFLVSFHADLILTLVASAIIGAIASMIVGIPALKINGLFLSVATLAFAVPVDTYLLNATNFPSLNPAHLNPPMLLNNFDLSNIRIIYEFSLFIAVLCMLIAWNLKRSRTGRVLIGARENETAAEAFGVDPRKIRLAAFGISGAMASVAGGLIVVLQQGTSFSGFDPQLSISAFSIVVIGGLTSLPGAILASIYYGIISYELHGAAQLLASGAALLILLLFLPSGLGGIITTIRDKLLYYYANFKHIEVPSLFEEAKFEPIVTSDIVYSNQKESTLNVDSLYFMNLKQVNANYQQVQVLFGIDLDIEKNNITAILGTNGAGKSTVLRSICGLMDNITGQIIFNSIDISSMSPEKRVSLGIVMVPGGRGTFPNLTIKENLQLAKWIHKKDTDFIQTTLNKIYSLFPVLNERQNAKAWMLSGGEQQMLAISQALLCKPKLLLIDELSLGLAPIVVTELIKIIKELTAEGITVVIVEQSINVATSVAQKSIFLERGQVRFCGNSEDLILRSDLLRSIFIDSNMKISSRSSNSQSQYMIDSGKDPGNTEPNDLNFDNRSIVFRGHSLSKHFGGIMAVDEVSIDIAQKEIHGIIGANGAGKTTLFDICSGFLIPDGGYVTLDGIDITNINPSKRARMGMGRVFQHAQMFPALTVTQTIALAHERFIFPKEPISSALRLPSVIRIEKTVQESVDSLLDFFHLTRFQNAFISELSTGTRRIVELACSLAHRPKVLLMDEPSSGLAQKESEALADLLLKVSEATNAALLIIEHDIPLISSVASHLTCLNLGQIIASGTPKEVLSDESVIESYLGTDSTAISRSNSS